jgi:DNA-binding CsgD family transcriptional regulator
LYRVPAWQRRHKGHTRCDADRHGRVHVRRRLSPAHFVGAQWHAGSVSPSIVSPVLIGRTHELHRLREALVNAPSAVLLGGEAGVGKTRLVREFGAHAQATGARLLLGGCLELGADGLPFAPFTAVLRGLVREIGTDGVEALLPPSSVRGLARLLPEFGEPEPDATSDLARARLFELVLTLLERLAERTPTVLVIEDAHWADRSTRDLLSFLIRNLGGRTALLVVVTYRSDELHRGHPLRRLFAGVERVDRVERHELSRLTRREAADLMRGILDREPAAPLVEQVYTRSEGNPLFIEALLNCEDGDPGAELPESLRDLLLAGVQRLPEETQELLRVASGAGDHFEHALLAAVAGLDEAALTRTLRPAVAANVLAVEGDGYAFRHALIREAVHDDLLPGEHTRLHARYAEALDADPALAPAGRLAVELAHHWYSAHDATWALISAWRAAEEAHRSAAYAESLEMRSRVLELWDQVPDAAERIGHPRAHVLEKVVGAADLAGEHERGVKLATAALKEIDDPIRAAFLLEQRGRMSMHFNRPEGIDDLREAVRRIPADPPSAERARVLATMAEQIFKLDGAGDARSTAEEAVIVARQVGDTTAEVSALLTLTCLDSQLVDDDTRLATLDEIALLAEGSRSYRPVLRVFVLRSHILEGTGRYEEAIEVARRGVEKAREHGLARVAGTGMAINLAEPLVSAGRWDEALAVIEQALDQDPVPGHRASLWQLAGDVALARGDLDKAEAALATASKLTPRGPTRRAEALFCMARLTAQLELTRGRPREAITAIEPVVVDLGLSDDARYAWPALVVGAQACADSGDHQAFAPIAARAEKLGVYSPVHRAHQLTFAAEAARLAADVGTGGPALWDAAASAWKALARPHPLALALTRAAEAAAPLGDRDGAVTRLDEAARLADRLGVRPLLARIHELSRRVRVTRADAAPLGLTPRELEVLRLVTEGRSNREIAAALFISAKTASVHVSNILTKLDVTGRGEAAAVAHRARLFEDQTASPAPRTPR